VLKSNCRWVLYKLAKLPHGNGTYVYVMCVTQCSTTTNKLVHRIRPSGKSEKACWWKSESKRE